MFVLCKCCVLSGRGLCDGLITRPEESYQLVRRCVWYRNLEHEEAKARYRAVKNTTTMSCNAKKKQIIYKSLFKVTNILLIHIDMNLAEIKYKLLNLKISISIYD
jgi:hypothetical protein